MSKAKTKVPKARNYHCLNSILRHAGSMGDDRKELDRIICRKPVDRCEDLEDEGEDNGEPYPHSGSNYWNLWNEEE